MKIITRSLIALTIGVILTACSEKKGDTPPPENPTSFAVFAPNGAAYNNDQKVAVRTLAADGALRLEFHVKNNTAAAQTFTLSQRIVTSNYTNIANHATFCWDLCYTAPLSSAGLTANNIIEAGTLFKASSGDMLNIDPATTPSFEATVEYTITNKGNGEKFTLTGAYKYTNPAN